MVLSDQRVDINPVVWGPPGWLFLDYVIEGYPARASYADQESMLRFLKSLGLILPCEKCRRNYIEFSLLYPPDQYVHGKNSVKQWLQAYKNSSKK